MKEALFYEKQNDYVKCVLCPVLCTIYDGNTGFCKIRMNTGGILFAKNYGLVSSLAFDPIEKKPLYHFHSNSMILSAGGYSCNMRCPFCQNHGISMDKPALEYLSPDALSELAEKYTPRGNIGVAYTYNEPFINYEYLLDCCKAVKDRGLKNVLVTNGYVNSAPLTHILPYIDAMNIDLKGGRRFYEEIEGGLDDVKRTISLAAESCHVEVTTLIIPHKNDSLSETEEAAAWLASVSSLIPLHLSRFFPRYHMADGEATPKSTLYSLKQIAEKHLKHVYIGNI